MPRRSTRRRRRRPSPRPRRRRRRAARTSAFVHFVHQATSSSVPGPKARSHRRNELGPGGGRVGRRKLPGPIDHACPAVLAGDPRAERTGAGDQALRGHQEQQASRHADRALVPFADGDLELQCEVRDELRQLVRRPGARARPAPPSSRPRGGRSTRRHPGRRRRRGASPASLRRSPGTRAFVHEACRTAARSSGTTNIVRRMASIRSRVRRSYSASSRSATANGSRRARAASTTVAGSTGVQADDVSSDLLHRRRRGGEVMAHEESPAAFGGVEVAHRRPRSRNYRPTV